MRSGFLNDYVEHRVKEQGSRVRKKTISIMRGCDGRRGGYGGKPGPIGFFYSLHTEAFAAMLHRVIASLRRITVP